MTDKALMELAEAAKRIGDNVTLLVVTDEGVRFVDLRSHIGSREIGRFHGMAKGAVLREIEGSRQAIAEQAGEWEQRLYSVGVHEGEQAVNGAEIQGVEYREQMDRRQR